MVLPARWSDDETDDVALGSGASQYPWWVSIRIDPNDSSWYRVESINPDYSDSDVSEHYVSRGCFRTIVRDIAFGRHDVGERIVGYIKDDDLDADAVDVVFQIACFGKVIYS